MVRSSGRLLLHLAILPLVFIFRSSQADQQSENGVKTKVFLSPKFELEPGSVSNKYYYNIDFPKGHIAIKSFDAEVIDENGSPIPLHETYLHHWVVVRYLQRRGVNILKPTSTQKLHQSDYIVIKINGLCDHGLIQYFGLGSETRKTATRVPDPYGIEVGNPSGVPAGYEELWMLNVHAIDTRGAEDKVGCTECRCDLYNVTGDEYGRLLPENYEGGLRCCYDGTRCRVKKGFQGVKRSLYLRYKVTYADWDAYIVPVRIYILDVTDIWTKTDDGLKDRHRCLVEYDVESCPVGGADDSCTHTKTITVSFPTGGYIIYGVGHQHAGGIGSTLYGEGGREICSSKPTYGTGDEPGNEAGYIVGMSTCYPSPGSVKISAGEMLTLVSNYSSAQRHTGVMGLFYLLISDSLSKPNVALHSADEAREITTISKFCYGIALFGIGVLVIVAISTKSGREGYEAITE
ncbi:hypothetical protein OROHE_000278 [Orobanche hederae]